MQLSKPNGKSQVKYLWNGDGIIRIDSEIITNNGKAFGKPIVDNLEIKHELGKPSSPNVPIE